MTYLRSILSFLVLALIFAACDSAPGVNSNESPDDASNDDASNTITLTLDRFYVRADCDGIEGDGEFRFRAIVQNGPTREEEISRSGVLGDGDSIILNEEVVFDADRTPDHEFAVTFYSTETDRDLFTGAFSDSRMDNRRAVKRHEFTSSGWTNLKGGDRIMLVNGSQNCQAELFYSVDVI
jgi:thiol-activated cytolysin